jgi:hypothetical protein
MGPKVIVISLAILLGVWLALFSREQTAVETETAINPVETTSDPADRGDVAHLLETHGIHIGEATESDIIVKRAGDKIQIEVTEKFLGEVPETFLATMGWTRPINWVSEEGYSEFLDSMHTYLIEEMPEEHGHSHDEHGHEHDH